MNKKKLLSFAMAAVMFLSLFAGLYLGTVPVQAEDGLVVHLKFDGDLTDASGSSNNAVIDNGIITYEEGIYGKSAVFNGKSYLKIEDNDSLDLKQLTISLWAYKSKLMKDDYVPYVYKEHDEEVWKTPYYLKEHFHNRPMIELHETYTDLDQFYLDMDPIDIQKWFLLTVTFDGDEVKMYEDDVLIKKESVNGAPNATIGDLYIGMGEGEYFFNGNMDDLRIYNRALSSQEVANLYQNGLDSNPKFLTQTDSLVAHYKFNGDFNDASKFGNDAEVVAGKISFIDGVNGKAAKFGKRAYLEVLHDASINFDEGFSATGWLCQYTGEDNNTILYKPGVSTSNTPNESPYHLYVRDDYYNMDYVAFGDQPPQEYAGYTTESTMKNKWIHFAVTFNGEEFRWYQNGKVLYKQAVSEDEKAELAHSVGNLMIGSNGDDFFDGAMDELKLYNYGLSAKEVLADANNKDSISISKENQKAVTALKAKGTVTLNVYRKYIETGESTKLSKGVTYKSSSTKVFTVSKTGKITAVKKGKAKLTITHGGVSKTYTVTVK